MRNESLIVTCLTHNLTWDMDFDPPQCDCYDTILEVVEHRCPTCSSDDPSDMDCGGVGPVCDDGWHTPIQPPIDWAALLGVDTDDTDGVQ